MGIEGGGEVALARVADVLVGGWGTCAVEEDDVRGAAGVEEGLVDEGSDRGDERGDDVAGISNSDGRTFKRRL